MRSPLLALAMAAVTVLLAGCVSSEQPEDPQSESPEVVEPTEASTEPAVLSYGEISGFEAAAEAAGPVLEYEQTGLTGFHLVGAQPQEAIYVVGYRLDEDTNGWDRDARNAIAAEYDAISANESDSSSVSALVAGHQSLFRYAVFLDANGKYVYQWNTFVFDGYDVIQITCQWRNEREQIQSGCKDLQTGFRIDRA